MKTYRKISVGLLCASVLALAACGEGWEMVQVRNQVPYTEERTAGPGIAYVRAMMMPEKKIIIPQEPMMAPAPTVQPETTLEKTLLKK